MTYTKLPYEFDLLFDIKSIERLHNLINDDSFDCFQDEYEVFALMEAYNIPFPEGFRSPIKPGFPKVVWIDKNGGYVKECPEDAENYQRMKIS